MFLPDRNLGAYVQQQTGRKNIKIWQGSLHRARDLSRAASLTEAKHDHPEAKIVAHPECPPQVLALADFIGSTSAIIQWCANSDAHEFIVMTESGVKFTLGRQSPAKKFYFVANENCNCSECPYMKLNTLEKLRDALINLEPRVELSPDLMRRALTPIERMLAVR